MEVYIKNLTKHLLLNYPALTISQKANCLLSIVIAMNGINDITFDKICERSLSNILSVDINDKKDNIDLLYLLYILHSMGYIKDDHFVEIQSCIHHIYEDKIYKYNIHTDAQSIQDNIKLVSLFLLYKQNISQTYIYRFIDEIGKRLSTLIQLSSHIISPTITQLFYKYHRICHYLNIRDKENIQLLIQLIKNGRIIMNADQRLYSYFLIDNQRVHFISSLEITELFNVQEIADYILQTLSLNISKLKNHLIKLTTSENFLSESILSHYINRERELYSLSCGLPKLLISIVLLHYEKNLYAINQNLPFLLLLQ